MSNPWTTIVTALCFASGLSTRFGFELNTIVYSSLGVSNTAIASQSMQLS